MCTGCQRNAYWLATNHLSGRGLVQPINELSSAAGRCAGRGCALVRQLANEKDAPGPAPLHLMSRRRIIQCLREPDMFTGRVNTAPRSLSGNAGSS